MAIKEDILEQIVEGYLIHKGYFVRHNIKFKPRPDHPDFHSKKDSNHSDIDVMGYHPMIDGERKVMVVSCKSWQEGFNPASMINDIKNDKKVGGREAWKFFRELTVPKWTEAFLDTVKEATGESRFTYVTAVTYLSGNNKDVWKNHAPFRDALGGNPVTILTLHEMASEIQTGLDKTLAATEVGRMLQLFSAAGMKVADTKTV